MKLTAESLWGSDAMLGRRGKAQTMLAAVAAAEGFLA